MGFVHEYRAEIRTMIRDISYCWKYVVARQMMNRGKQIMLSPRHPLRVKEYEAITSYNLHLIGPLVKRTLSKRGSAHHFLRIIILAPEVGKYPRPTSYYHGLLLSFRNVTGSLVKSPLFPSLHLFTSSPL